MSRQQLESAYRGVLDRQMLEALDEPWVCGSDRHATDAAHHDGPATHLIGMGCECFSGFRCASLVAATTSWLADGRRLGYVGFTCQHCGTRTLFNDIRITPLGVKS